MTEADLRFVEIDGRVLMIEANTGQQRILTNKEAAKVRRVRWQQKRPILNLDNAPQMTVQDLDATLTRAGS